MIFTVFPEDNNRMPQDFETYEEAEEYGDENEPDGYTIESTSGDIV